MCLVIYINAYISWYLSWYTYDIYFQNIIKLDILDIFMYLKPIFKILRLIFRYFLSKQVFPFLEFVGFMSRKVLFLYNNTKNNNNSLHKINSVIHSTSVIMTRQLNDAKPLKLNLSRFYTEIILSYLKKNQPIYVLIQRYTLRRFLFQQCYYSMLMSFYSNEYYVQLLYFSDFFGRRVK